MANLRAFTMPKWGIEMQEGTLAEWLVAEGAAFAKGDLIALIETDKITNEVEAERDGVLARIVTPAGETKPVGALLGVFADGPAEGSEVDVFLGSFRAADTSTAVGRGAGGPVPKPEPERVPLTTPAAPTPHIPDDVAISPAARRLAEDRGLDVTTVTGSGPHGRITYQDVDQASRQPAPAIGGAPISITVETGAAAGAYASPLAKRLAAQHGVDLTGLTGTGPRGRISKADVLARVAPASPRAGAAPDILPMDKVRRVIARRLTEAKQTIPHFYLRAEARLDKLIELRRIANLVIGEKASLNDFIVRAAALALIEAPDCNVQVHGDAIHRFHTADIAVAVATDRGLVTPVVRGVDSLAVHELAAATRALIAKAQAGRLAYEDMEGGSFTVSNLGMFGIDDFDAIINPPQGAILAVGGLRRVWGEQADGSGAFESRMTFTLSCDHRAIDGAVGARFLAAFKRLIETPERLFREG
ncbi:MAG TPA: 2-oxo acid dehydrogenase subunit E2 [Sphingomonas sp.]|nr:2-oxo acid dehydrogenase subunit E2 [Sphingomonas sp.]